MLIVELYYFWTEGRENDPQIAQLLWALTLEFYILFSKRYEKS